MDSAPTLLRVAADIVERFLGSDHPITATQLRIYAACAEHEDT
ncbi:hypothetical protein QNA24_29995 [Rhodococcus qingshengii]|nr:MULTISPECIES: hypothetical protein [Rhodococcus]MCQ4136599.1 hypothetical protein [Rhodococcus rhodochrous]MDJ0490616.1 hypothetical protein [Rhodococcus qingshengii]